MAARLEGWAQQTGPADEGPQGCDCKCPDCQGGRAKVEDLLLREKPAEGGDQPSSVK